MSVDHLIDADLILQETSSETVTNELSTDPFYPLTVHSSNDLKAVNDSLSSYLFALSILEDALTEFLQHNYKSDIERFRKTFF